MLSAVRLAFFGLALLASPWVFAPAASAQAPRACETPPCTLVSPSWRQVGFGRGAAFFGLVSGAALLGTSATLAIMDDGPANPALRGAWLAGMFVAPPLVMGGGRSSKKRGGVMGSGAAFTLGWSLYAAALASGGAQLAFALADRRVAPGLTAMAGVFGGLAQASFSFDAWIASRRARMQVKFGGISLTPGPP